MDTINIKGLLDFYNSVGHLQADYVVKVGAFSQTDYVDTVTIHKFRIDEDKKEVVLYGDVILQQVSPEHTQARDRVLREYIVECERQALEIARLKESLNKEQDACAEKDLEIERAWRSQKISAGEYGAVREVLSELREKIRCYETKFSILKAWIDGVEKDCR